MPLFTPPPNFKFDLRVYEIPNTPPIADESYEIGDLHGNSLLMLKYLTHYGVLTLKEGQEDYNKFYTAYNKFGSIIANLLIPKGDVFEWPSQEQINHAFSTKREELKKILSIIELTIQNATVRDIPCTVRMIGDTLADRGMCDLVTLLLYKKLASARAVQVEVIYSNHDARFVAYINNVPPACHFHCSLDLSLATLKGLISVGIITKDRVEAMYESFFRPQLKLLSYSKRDSHKKNPEIRLYFHAVNGLQQIEQLTQDFLKQTLHIDSESNLYEIIDKINVEFQKYLLSDSVKNRDDKWLAIENFVSRRDNDTQLAMQDDIHRKRIPKRIMIIHGHDGIASASASANGEVHSFVHNLNGIIGRPIYGALTPKNALQVWRSMQGSFFINNEIEAQMLGKTSGPIGVHLALSGAGSAGLLPHSDSTNSLVISKALAAASRDNEVISLGRHAEEEIGKPMTVSMSAQSSNRVDESFSRSICALAHMNRPLSASSSSSLSSITIARTVRLTGSRQASLGKFPNRQEPISGNSTGLDDDAESLNSSSLLSRVSINSIEKNRLDSDFAGDSGDDLCNSQMSHVRPEDAPKEPMTFIESLTQFLRSEPVDQVQEPCLRQNLQVSAALNPPLHSQPASPAVLNSIGQHPLVTYAPRRPQGERVPVNQNAPLSSNSQPKGALRKTSTRDTRDILVHTQNQPQVNQSHRRTGSLHSFWRAPHPESVIAEIYRGKRPTVPSLPPVRRPFRAP